MVDTVLADQVAYLLRAGGELFVQTDVWDIALDAMRSFDGDDRFVNLAGEWTFWKHGNPYGVRSWREQNAEETDLPIWRILYRRQA
jgi:tRNA G46 methylase TrmB